MAPIVVLNAGDLNIGAFDAFSTLIPIAHESGAWVHVDGAFGLFARTSRTKSHLVNGVELADSWATDVHKWLNVPFDCGVAIVRDCAGASGRVLAGGGLESRLTPVEQDDSDLAMGGGPACDSGPLHWLGRTRGWRRAGPSRCCPDPADPDAARGCRIGRHHGIGSELRESQDDKERFHRTAVMHLQQQYLSVQSKLDRAYEDRLAGKITDELWARKSETWEAELEAIRRETGRHEKASHDYSVTGSKILELAKNAHNLFIQQNSREQSRLLKTLLSNCTFDRGSLLATYTKPFDLFVQGNETEDWLGDWDSNR